jgi:hypothetical protein
MSYLWPEIPRQYFMYGMFRLILDLSDPIDVFSEWIDECRKVNEVEGSESTVRSTNKDSEGEDESAEEDKPTDKPATTRKAPPKKKPESEDPDAFLASHGLGNRSDEEDDDDDEEDE